MTNSKVYSRVLIGYVYCDHRTSPVKGIRAASPPLTGTVSMISLQVRRSGHLLLSCSLLSIMWPCLDERPSMALAVMLRIVSALPSDSGASSAGGRCCQGCVSTAKAAPALTDTSDADMISPQMQSETLFTGSIYLLVTPVP